MATQTDGFVRDDQIVPLAHPASGQETKEQVGGVDARGDDHGITARPPVGKWLRLHWLDILTLAVMGAVGLGVYFLRPAPSRSFPVYNLDGKIANVDFAYPLRREIIPIWAAALLASLVPLAVFSFMQLRIKSFWDFNNAVFGLLYALITAAVFQVFIKWLIGGLRPHFLEVCKPDPKKTGQNGLPMEGSGWENIMFDRKVCMGNEREINDALESFPSGHTTAAFAGFGIFVKSWVIVCASQATLANKVVFLSLYLNAKFQVFSDYRPAYWKIVLMYMPILGAVLIGGALTIDEFHNWWDIFAGAIIGTLMAFSAFRMVYASIWNYDLNHIPLHPEIATPGVDTSDFVWTHKAGRGGRPASIANDPNHTTNSAHMV